MYSLILTFINCMIFKKFKSALLKLMKGDTYEYYLNISYDIYRIILNYLETLNYLVWVE
jgi:hypothetical protein